MVPLLALTIAFFCHMFHCRGSSIVSTVSILVIVSIVSRIYSVSVSIVSEVYVVINSMVPIDSIVLPHTYKITHTLSHIHSVLIIQISIT
jgi:hypothetical protein